MRVELDIMWLWHHRSEQHPESLPVWPGEPARGPILGEHPAERVAEAAQRGALSRGCS